MTRFQNDIDVVSFPGVISMGRFQEARSESSFQEDIAVASIQVGIAVGRFQDCIAVPSY